VCPFYRDREGVGASGGGGGINASHFDIERKKGGQWGGEAIRWGKSIGRRACYRGGRRMVGRPGRQRAVAPDRGGGSVLLDWRKEKAGWAFWPKGFLGWTVLLGRADRVGRNQIKSFSNFYLNSRIWQDFKILYKEI
jgi:hypothetical protein